MKEALDLQVATKQAEAECKEEARKLYQSIVRNEVTVAE